MNKHNDIFGFIFFILWYMFEYEQFRNLYETLKNKLINKIQDLKVSTSSS